MWARLGLAQAASIAVRATLARGTTGTQRVVAPPTRRQDLAAPGLISQLLLTGRARGVHSRPQASCAPDMDDEYGDMRADGHTHVFDTHRLESGRVLEQVSVNYKTFGQLNAQRDNAMVVCHALTGNASLDSWWGDLLGPGKVFDTDRYFVVCANILGSCYGTCGPLSVDPASGRPYAAAFPQVTVRDSVGLHARLVKDVLDVQQIHSVIGGSLGGMQTLEWAFLEPGLVKSIVAMACGADHSAWQIGVSEVQRQAIYADPKWKGGHYDASAPPASGLSVARQMAMITYRSHPAYIRKFGRETARDGSFQVESYLHHQGVKFFERFDAVSYVRLTELMDSHDVGRGRGGVEVALSGLRLPVLVVGVDSDVLYPLAMQEDLHTHIPDSELAVIESPHGHDGFLLEQDQLSRAIRTFFAKVHCSRLVSKL